MERLLLNRSLWWEQPSMFVSLSNQSTSLNMRLAAASFPWASCRRNHLRVLGTNRSVMYDRWPPFPLAHQLFSVSDHEITVKLLRFSFAVVRHTRRFLDLQTQFPESSDD